MRAAGTAAAFSAPAGRVARGHGVRAFSVFQRPSDQGVDSSVLLRLFRVLHVLPRRTGAAEARSGLFDDILPDVCARRRAGGRIRGTGGAARVLRILRAASCAWESARSWFWSSITAILKAHLQNAAGNRLGSCWFALVVAIVASLFITAQGAGAEARLTVRNFYGVLRVIDGRPDRPRTSVRRQGQARQSLDDDARYRRLMNGTINHGLEFLAPSRAALADNLLRRGLGNRRGARAARRRGPLRVGVIGLGAGTIAAYGRPGDRYTFYEINPLDVRIAQSGI